MTAQLSILTGRLTCDWLKEVQKVKFSIELGYDSALESKKELRWAELNFLSPFPGFFYEILLEHCAKNQLQQTASSVQRLHKTASKNLPSNRRWPQKASYDKNEHKKTRSLLKPQIFVFGFYQDKMAINYCITIVQTKPCFTSCAAGNHKNTAGQNQPKNLVKTRCDI